MMTEKLEPDEKTIASVNASLKNAGMMRKARCRTYLLSCHP